VKYLQLADKASRTVVLSIERPDHDRRRDAGAKSKRTGLPCRSPAVQGYRVCRMHGARGGAPTGKRNGKYRQGMRTKESTNAIQYVNALGRLARN